MAIRVIRLGSARSPGEGLRIGTVRRPPRGVRRADYAAHDWYDTWLPQLAPAAETVKAGFAAQDAKGWAAFTKQYRREMAAPDASRLLDLLAALSKSSDFSVGCYCEDESRCHRSILKELLIERRAIVL